MKNTHIILKLEDIEEQLKLYNKAIKEAALDRTEEGKLKFIKFTGKYFGLDKVFELGKQISLDETSVEEKANETFTNKFTYYKVRRQGYKQAFIDIIR